ncbi:MAG: hypothetical protein K9W44_01815 [Candidatus Lokiarchaeota archaeon]|nr:hypothetical protein [Candidatus Harpocratesius repetitus]
MIFSNSEFEPIEKEIPVVIVLYIIIIIQVLILVFILYYRWRTRKVIAVRHLVWSFSSYLLAFICFLISVLEGFFTGYKMEIYRYGMGIAYFFFIIGHVLFIFFIKDIFGINWKFLWKYIIIGIFIAILVILPQNYYGVPTGSEGSDNIRFYSSCAMLAYSILLFGRAVILTSQVYRRISVKYARYGFIGFLIAEYAMILVFLFILADFLYWEFNLYSGYTVFYYLAVISGMTSIAGFYLGIVIPSKLQSNKFQKITEETLKKNQREENNIEDKEINEIMSKKSAVLNSRSIGWVPLPKSTGEHPAIQIQCPTCYKFLYYEIPDSLIEKRTQNPKNLVSIKVPSGLICEHSFLIYIDKQFAIRSYSPIDLEHRCK